MIYVVLGMHKSGTTLVSQILHHSGISMVDELDEDITYDSGNKYERQKTLTLNMDILGVKDYQVRELANPDSLKITDDQRGRMQTILDDASAQYSDWGCKDPRTALTYPLWKEVIGEHKIIAIYRNPEEIWPRFRWQGWRRKYVNPLWAYQYISRWVEHNINLIKYCSNLQGSYLLLDYHSLMTTDKEFKRIEAFTGESLTDMRKKELYRVRKPKKDYTLAIASWVYKVVNGRSYNEIILELEKLQKKHKITQTTEI